MTSRSRAVSFALSDVISLFVGNGAEPKAIVVVGAVLGVLTFAGIALAAYGRLAGPVIVIVTRSLSALSALPALLASVPVGVKISVVVACQQRTG